MPLRPYTLPLLAIAVVGTLFGCSRGGNHLSPPTPVPLKPIEVAESGPVAVDADYVDVAKGAGLNYRWTHQTKGTWTNLDAFGAGCAFVDYDNDGWVDVFLAGAPRCALYRNNHDGTFTDVSERAGITRQGTWHGIAVGDYDNDGYEDIYVSGYHCSMLLHNNRSGAFTDVTNPSGLTETQWGSCCCWFDADNDGKLDLIVGHYVESGEKYPWYCTSPSGVVTGCRPQAYPAQYPKLYHNNGDGTFTDYTARCGLGAAHGKALAIQVFDFDNDGRPDFYIANDGEPGDLFHNVGGGKFENVGVQDGAAYDIDGASQAGMGVDSADYDHDGRMDFVVPNWQGEIFSLYHNEGASFTLQSLAAGLGPTRTRLGFGVRFLDFNNDSWPDLVFADGHVYDNASAVSPGVTFRQTPLLFRNQHGHFQLVKNPGPAFLNPIVARGLSVGDVRNNGQQDILVVDYDGSVKLFHNRAVGPNHWLEVKLVGGKSNRDGYGARVTLKWQGGQSIADCTTSGSYLSATDARIHFGLGDSRRVQALLVHWPDGKTSRLNTSGVDRIAVVRE